MIEYTCKKKEVADMKRIIIFIMAAALALSIAACTPAPAEGTQTDSEQQADTESRKVIVVVALDNYQPKELWPVYDTLSSEGFYITVAGSETGTAKSGSDSIEIDAAFSQLSAEGYDGIVVIGGPGVKTLWDNEELLSLISDIYDNGGVAAAICLAPLTLANAGVLKEGESACWFSDSDINGAMQQLGITDSGQEVTASGRVITGSGPGAADDFAYAVAEALSSL